MTRFLKILRLWLLAVLFLPAAHLPADDSSAAAPAGPSRRVKVGLIIPLTGPKAYLGNDSLAGARFALDEIRSGRGEARGSIELAVEDSQGDARQGLNAYRKLVSEGAKFVITQHSNVSLPIAQVVNRDGVIQLALMTTADSYSTPDDNTFRVDGTAADEAGFIAEYVSSIQKSSPGPIAAVALEDEYPLSMLAAFESALAAKSLKLGKKETFLPSESDFRGTIGRLKASGATVLVMVSYTAQSGAFLKQAHELDFKPTVIGCMPMTLPDLISAAGSVSEGVRGVAFKINPSTPAAVAFKEKTGNTPTPVTAKGYDAVRIADRALQTCEYVDNPACLRRALFGLGEYRGMGGEKRFDSRYGDMQDDFEILIVRQGHFVPMGGK